MWTYGDSWIYYTPVPDAVKGSLFHVVPCQWGGFCGL